MRSAGRENLIPQSDPYSDDVVIGVNTLPLGPSWVNKFDNTNEKIKEIKNKSKEFCMYIYIVKYLKKLQIERIKPNFDEEAVEKLDKEIGTLMLDLTIVCLLYSDHLAIAKKRTECDRYNINENRNIKNRREKYTEIIPLANYSL